jgi:methylmalonyl-CoA mutase C-terminal domain/subunit
VFGGGIVPPADIATLKQQGVAEIFTPGASMVSITDWLEHALEATT